MSDSPNSLDPPAFDQVYREEGSCVRRFLRVFLRNEAGADEVLQETFLHFWKRPTGFDRTKGSVRSYLFGIARRKAADWRQRNIAPVSSADVGSLKRPSSSFLLIEDALASLPEESRSILWLREVEGYSYEELAGILKIPTGTVRSRLHAARQQLRRVWNEGSK